MKNIILQPRNEKWITDVAGISEYERCRNLTWHILGWCHSNFIKPKTYSALLSPKAYDSPHLWKEFMRVTKHFLQINAEITMYIWHTYLPSYVD
jgi:hypothetical protein